MRLLRYVTLSLLLALPVSAAPKTPELRHLFLGAVYEEEMTPFVQGLVEAVQKGEPVVLVDVNSPGGSVAIGLAVADVMMAADKAGTKTLCVVDGMAASMGAYLLQACSYRVMTKRSQILFHEPSLSEVGGKEWTLRRAADHLADTNHRMAIFICGKLNISVPEYEKKIKDRDWWLSPQEAKDLGAVDLVVPVS